jgi:hypothetical protein
MYNFFDSFGPRTQRVTVSDIGGNCSPSSASPDGVQMVNLVILFLSYRLGGFFKIEVITGGGRGSLSGSGQIGSGTLFKQSHSQRKV